MLRISTAHEVFDSVSRWGLLANVVVVAAEDIAPPLVPTCNSIGSYPRDRVAITASNTHVRSFMCRHVGTGHDIAT